MNENLLKLLECFHKHLDHYMEIEDRVEMIDLLDNVRADLSTTSVVAGRATSEQLSEIGKDVEKVFGPACERCGYVTTHCKCPVASERAEPTATEPEVPDEDRCILHHGETGRQWLNRMSKTSSFCSDDGSKCDFTLAPDVPSEGQCTTIHDGVRCRNARPNNHWTTCRGPCDFGDAPDVPSEGEDRCSRAATAFNLHDDNRDSTLGAYYQRYNAYKAGVAQAKRDTDELRAKLKTAEDAIARTRRCLEKAGDA